MSDMTPVPKNHPLMIAWEAHKATPEYENSLKWAMTLSLEDRGSGVQAIMHPHTEGSMWACFLAGWQAKGGAPSSVPQPQGFVLVPREPTKEMIDAGLCGCMDNDVTVCVYQRMLAAAPHVEPLDYADEGQIRTLLLMHGGECICALCEWLRGLRTRLAAAPHVEPGSAGVGEPVAWCHCPATACFKAIGKVCKVAMAEKGHRWCESCGRLYALGAGPTTGKT